MPSIASEPPLQQPQPTGKPLITVFIPSFRGGGAERAMLLFAEGLLQLGHPVDVIVASSDGPLRNLVPSGAEIIDLKASRMFKAIPRLVLYLRRRKPLKLFATISHTNIIAILGNFIAGSPSSVIIRESNSPISESKQSLSRRIVHFLVPFIYPFASAIIAVSEGVADEIRSLGTRIGKRLVVLPTPVITPSLFTLSEQHVDHPWLQDDKIPVIVGVGRLHPQKDFPGLIRAFSIVRQTITCRLIILGEGSCRPELEALIDSLGLKSEISLPGFTQNPFPYFKRAAVFVLSSIYEGMPNVLIQAMALGTKCVSTDCKSGPRECTDNGRFAELVPLQDPQLLADAIVRVLRNPDNEREKQAAQRMKEQYGLLEATKGYLTAGVA